MVINTNISVVSTFNGLQRRSVVQDQDSTQFNSKKVGSSPVDLRSTVEAQNIKSASDRIQDVDVALEYTDLAKYQLQVQSRETASAQANISPEHVLKLLGETLA